MVVYGKEQKTYVGKRVIRMMSIEDLINKQSVSIDADEDMEFKLMVTAEWDNIIESLNRI